MPIWFKSDPDKPAVKVQSMTITFGNGRESTTTNGFMTNHPGVILSGQTELFLRPVEGKRKPDTDPDVT